MLHIHINKQRVGRLHVRQWKTSSRRPLSWLWHVSLKQGAQKWTANLQPAGRFLWERMLDSGEQQPDFSSTPGMDLPVHVSVNVIFTQLKHLRCLLALDPGLRCESESQGETDGNTERMWEIKSVWDNLWIHSLHAYVQTCACAYCRGAVSSVICPIWPQCRTFTAVLQPHITFTSDWSNVILHSTQYFDLWVSKTVEAAWW